ncbi:MAG: gliding motility-associated C-terminal domain-containing protein [Bacteroidales bacterium]
MNHTIRNCFKLLIGLVMLIFVSKSATGQVLAGDDLTISSGVPVLLDGQYSGYTGIRVTAQDDFFVGPFPIGFEFTYFGNTYIEFAIGPNGLLSFNLPEILDVVYWINVPIPNNIFKATIMGPYQDIFQRPIAPHNRYIYYQTVGTAPDRKLIVGWCEAPLFGCPDSPVTLQIVLNEIDHSIENHLIEKPACEANLGNRATHGLNYDDQLGISVPGRNNTSWTAFDESWRFEPNGNNSYTVSAIDFHPEPIIPPGHLTFAWYKNQYPGGEIVSPGNRLIVYPAETTTYFCEVTLCGGLQYVDEITIQVIPVPNAFNPNSLVEENRTFRLFANPSEKIRDFSLHIHNRWGQQVFYSRDINEGWDGTSNGKPCNQGVYVWTIHYDGGEGVITGKGVVTLIK